MRVLLGRIAWEVAVLMWVQTPGAASFFLSHSQLSVQTLLQCLYSSCMLLHASCTLKIPNAGSHAVGHTEILHTLVEMGSTALAAAAAVPR